MKVIHECEVYGDNKPLIILCSYYADTNRNVYKVFGQEEDYLDFKSMGGFSDIDFGVWRVI